MESLALSLIAFCNVYKQEKSFVLEADNFQQFDVRALAQVYDAKNNSLNRPSDRSPTIAAQVAS
jgi:hypothetical protein